MLVREDDYYEVKVFSVVLKMRGRRDACIVKIATSTFSAGKRNGKMFLTFKMKYYSRAYSAMCESLKKCL